MKLLRLCIAVFILSTPGSLSIGALPFPIQFSISSSKLVSKIPEKDRDFAFIIPGNLKTYIYTNEEDYYHDYQRSYYAVTCKKAGWDCMRHYEILANGCIPYFVNLDSCDPRTMPFLPRNLIKEAMNLEGVSYLKIDHTKFNKEKYYSLLQKIMEHTRQYLTTKSMAAYIIKSINYKGVGKILFLSSGGPDYLSDATLMGLKELYGNRVVDFPRISYLYKNYPHDAHSLYGRGFTFSKVLDDLHIYRHYQKSDPDREVELNNTIIAQMILMKEFDLIVYGSVHRNLEFHDLVLRTYPTENIVYVCGEDAHHCPFAHYPNLFLREYDAIR